MLPPAALAVAGRLIATLLALANDVYDAVANASSPTMTNTTAITLFSRLSDILVTLIRLSEAPRDRRRRTSPDRAPPNPAPDSAPAPAPDPAPAPATAKPSKRRKSPLPTRSGWLLAALPRNSPFLAAQLRDILEDPALATLLQTAPGIRRSLNPILRALGTPPSRPRPNPRPHHPVCHQPQKPPASATPPRAPTPGTASGAIEFDVATPRASPCSNRSDIVTL